MQLVHMTDFRKAAVDDICAVHERSYVLGLEKLAARGKDEIVDGAPTYITGTSFNDALQVLVRNLLCTLLQSGPCLNPTWMVAPCVDARCIYAAVHLLKGSSTLTAVV